MPIILQKQNLFLSLDYDVFCSEGSKELLYLHQLTANPQKGRQCLSN